MGQIKKIGDTYFIEFYARGLLYSKVAGNDEAEALKLLAVTEQQIASGEMLTVVREISLIAFFDDFKQFSQEIYSPISMNRFTHVMQDLSNFLKITYPAVSNLSQMTPTIFEQYKKSLVTKVKPHLVTFSILLLREIMEHGIKIGFLNDNPTLHVTLMPSRKKKYKQTPRLLLAQELLNKSVGLGKAVKLLQLTDVARIMFFSNLIPLKREEMYNDAF